ncbi:MAG: dipicolinate synthase subunit B [Acutalibacteraceae bacterium]|nr:dipicolinate synthase subunit B [Acutalibacteraceae bacterium]
MKDLTAGYAMCGSFCTISDSMTALRNLAETGMNIIPIMSPILYNTDTRFTEHISLQNRVKEITGNDILHTIEQAEPIGPKKLLDVLIVAPCTGNTLGKLANGITDTSVTMAVKAHLRNNKPVILAIATNDALSASAKNIGVLLNTKNIYFVPYRQDDAINKPTSMIADFTKIYDTITNALQGKQLQPLLL